MEHVHEESCDPSQYCRLDDRTSRIDERLDILMLCDLVDHVIGVDTHRDTHTAAVVTAPGGGIVDTTTDNTTRAGYESLLGWAEDLTEAGERVWAIEGAGSYGVGLTRFLQAAGEWVIEIDRPSRPKPRPGQTKTDTDDAVRAGRDALGIDHCAEPRAGGDRDALRILLVAREQAVRMRTATINQLKADLVTAPAEIRHDLTGEKPTLARLVKTCVRLRDRPARSALERTSISTIRALARRIEILDAEIADHTSRISDITAVVCPALRGEVGIGPINAAKIYVSWSHAGRCRNESAFARLAGAAPVPASSGLNERHRLNSGGDRQLNRALHNIVIIRQRLDPATKKYFERRTGEGKTPREIRRCLKRYIARHVYRILESSTSPDIKTADRRLDSL